MPSLELLLGAATVCCLALAPAAHGGEDRRAKAPTFTKGEIRKLEEGEVVRRHETFEDAKGRSRGRGLAAVLVDAPPKAVWRHLTRPEEFDEFLPRLTESKVYEKEGRRLGVAYAVRVLLVTVRYHCLQTLEPERWSVHWTLDERKENGIAATTGFWRALPHGEGRSILVYAASASIGRAVPKFVEDFLTRRDLPGVVTAMKKRIESDGKYTK
jgi:carbon monoxide dehydrogenase subunit G